MGLEFYLRGGDNPLLFTLRFWKSSCQPALLLPLLAQAAAAQAAALQLNGAVPLGALNPAALTGRLELGEGREGLGPWKGRNTLLTLRASLCF